MIGIVMFFYDQIPLKVCLLLDFLVWNYNLTLCLRLDNLLNWWTSNVDFQCQPIQWALLLQRDLSTLYQLLFACFMKPMYEVMLPKNITQIKLITKHKHKHWVQDFYFRLITNSLFNVLSLKAKLIPPTKQSKELHITFRICQNFLDTHSWFKIHSQYITKGKEIQTNSISVITIQTVSWRAWQTRQSSTLFSGF